eukprot:TRINITY_DN3522_c0_g1_i1.p1 TRINITY_DN3522_c0_g1~~TRINITY_DN3522_c0_g1_i1.p1  ORF type:complete len:553 (+),score=124.02 TRINITY_DN3522_c0_g1_i1:181-1839(+)
MRELVAEVEAAAMGAVQTAEWCVARPWQVQGLPSGAVIFHSTFGVTPQRAAIVDRARAMLAERELEALEIDLNACPHPRLERARLHSLSGDSQTLPQIFYQHSFLGSGADAGNSLAALLEQQIPLEKQKRPLGTPKIPLESPVEVSVGSSGSSEQQEAAQRLQLERDEWQQLQAAQADELEARRRQLEQQEQALEQGQQALHREQQAWEAEQEKSNMKESLIRSPASTVTPGESSGAQRTPEELIGAFSLEVLDAPTVRVLSDAFALMDTDSNGYVGCQEGVEWSMTLDSTKDIRVVNKEWRERIKKYDSNGDSRIDLSEWLAFHEKLVSLGKQPNMAHKMPTVQQLCKHVSGEISRVKKKREQRLQTVAQVSLSQAGFSGILSADDEKKLRRRCPELTIGELAASIHRYDELRGDNPAISLHDVSAVLQANTPERQLVTNRLFKAIDTSGDGSLSRYEYLKLVHTCLHGDFDNRANFAFRVFSDERKTVSRGAIKEMAVGAASEEISASGLGELDQSIQACFVQVGVPEEVELEHEQFIEWCRCSSWAKLQ